MNAFLDRAHYIVWTLVGLAVTALCAPLWLLLTVLALLVLAGLGGAGVLVVSELRAQKAARR